MAGIAELVPGLAAFRAWNKQGTVSQVCSSPPYFDISWWTHIPSLMVWMCAHP